MMSEEKNLPSDNDLRGLTLRAMCAYAARAARRVRSLYSQGKAEYVAALDRGIERSERCAAGHKLSRADDASETNAAIAADSASQVATFVGAAAHAAANAAGTAFAASAREYFSGAAAHASSAAVCAVRAASSSGHPEADNLVAEGCVKDYGRLLSFSKGNAGSLGSPIRMEDLGPLWPAGQPVWPACPTWPIWDQDVNADYNLTNRRADEQLEFDVLPLSLLIDPGTASSEEVAELFGELSELYRTLGGRGLQFTLTDCRKLVVTEDRP